MEYNRVWFRDRVEAGQMLGRRLAMYAGRPDVLVLGLPRGGVPVAFQVARLLDAPLDVLIVRKLGVPGHEELAFGALASGGTRVLDQGTLKALGIGPETVEQVTARAQHELARRDQLYRVERAFPAVEHTTLIVVDDGMATGNTMQAGVEALRQQRPARLVVAVPVASRESVIRLRRVADEVVCLRVPTLFNSLGQWYADFTQTSDDEVRDLLARSGHNESTVDHTRA